MDIFIYIYKNVSYINYRLGAHILFPLFLFSTFFAKERQDAAKSLFARFSLLFSHLLSLGMAPPDAFLSGYQDCRS